MLKASTKMLVTRWLVATGTRPKIAQIVAILHAKIMKFFFFGNYTVFKPNQPGEHKKCTIHTQNQFWQRIRMMGWPLVVCTAIITTATTVTRYVCYCNNRSKNFSNGVQLIRTIDFVERHHTLLFLYTCTYVGEIDMEENRREKSMKNA